MVLAAGAGILVQGEVSPRGSDENLRQMKANHYGYVAGLEVPTDVRSWRSLLVGVPAIIGGVAVLIIVASVR